jgi:adenine-specific DNA-methyltransferase
VLVTNNEVSEAERRALKDAGHLPGGAEWERHGVCASVTWPRTKYSIMGRRDDGTALDGEYLTSLTQERPVRLGFHQIGFTTFHQLDTPAKKKQLVSLLGKDSLPQSLVGDGARFVVPEGHRATVLFDDSAVEEWLAALEDRGHLRDFYVVTQSAALFRGVKARVQEMLGGLTEPESVKLPMGGGFRANAEYFRLGFLDKNSVARGRQFREIVPLLWLKSGAKGRRQEVGGGPDGPGAPDMFFPDGGNFAVLAEETRIEAFLPELARRPGVEHVYLVTDSEANFHEMTARVGRRRTTQLYRDYLENFVINTRGE